MPSVNFNIKFTAAAPPTRATIKQLSTHAARRAFYTCNAKWNILEYLAHGKKTEKDKDILAYISHERGSAKPKDPEEAIFGRTGIYSDEELAEIKRRQQETPSIIWHGWLSVEGEYGGLGYDYCNTAEQAQRIMKSFDEFLRQSHLDPENIIWYANLHRDSKCRNIHFVFFELEPKRRRKGTDELVYTHKGVVPPRAVENHKVRLNLLLDQNKDQLASQRDIMMKRLKQSSSTDDSLLRGELVKLAAQLPTSGRLSYWSPNIAPLRERIDKLALKILCKDKAVMMDYMTWISELQQRDAKVLGIYREHKMRGHEAMIQHTKDDLDLSQRQQANYGDVTIIEQIREDLRGRLGNYVLSACKKLKQTPRKAGVGKDYGLGDAAPRRQARQKKSNLNRTMQHLLYEVTKGARDYFMETRQKLLEIEQQHQAQEDLI